MSMIPGIIRNLNHAAEHRLPEAQSSLGDAYEEIDVAAAIFAEATDGAQHPEVTETADQYDIAQQRIREAQQILDEALGKIATLRNKILFGPGSEIDSLISQYEDPSNLDTSLDTSTAYESFAAPESNRSSSSDMPDPAFYDRPAKRNQVSFEGNRRIYIQQLPYEDARAFADKAYAEQVAHNRSILEAIDSAPALNEQFTEEIAFAQDEVRELGLPLVPIVVLDQENFTRIMSLTKHDYGPESLVGGHMFGRIIVNADPPFPDLSSESKRQAVTDFIVHEAAHAAGYDPHIILRSEIGSDDVCHFNIRNRTGGFEKINLKVPTGNVGGCLEEGFAELTTVKINEETGRRRLPLTMESHEIDGMTFIGHHLSHYDLPRLDGPVKIPLTYAANVYTDDGREGKVPARSAPIAYAVQLMDEVRPGLYKDMLAARTDPKRQADVIWKINQIEPGLYKKLRDMPYTPENAVQFLRVVGEAIHNRYEHLESGRI